jgi:hypothetical protein
MLTARFYEGNICAPRS